MPATRINYSKAHRPIAQAVTPKMIRMAGLWEIPVQPAIQLQAGNQARSTIQGLPSR